MPTRTCSRARSASGRPRWSISAYLAAAALTLPIGIAHGFGAPPSTGSGSGWSGCSSPRSDLPFAALSASAPLLQSWFAASGHPQARNPYVLYAASNLGSFAALLAYPLAIESLLTLRAQAWIWSVGFAGLAVLVAAAAMMAARGAGDRCAAHVTPAERPTLRDRAVLDGARRHPGRTRHRGDGLHLDRRRGGAAALGAAARALSADLRGGVPRQAVVLARTGRAAGAVPRCAARNHAARQRPPLLGRDHRAAICWRCSCSRSPVTARSIAGARHPRCSPSSICGPRSAACSAASSPACSRRICSTSTYEYPILVIAASSRCRARSAAPSGSSPGASGRRSRSRRSRSCSYSSSTLPAQPSSVALLFKIGLVVLVGLMLLQRRDPARLAALAVTAFDRHGRVAARAERARNDAQLLRRASRRRDRRRHAPPALSRHHDPRREQVRDADGTPTSGRPEPLTYYYFGGPISEGIAAARAAQGGLKSVAAVGLGARAACVPSQGRRSLDLLRDRSRSRAARARSRACSASCRAARRRRRSCSATRG